MEWCESVLEVCKWIVDDAFSEFRYANQIKSMKLIANLRLDYEKEYWPTNRSRVGVVLLMSPRQDEINKYRGMKL